MGIEQRVGPQLLLHAEAASEFYRAQVVTYDAGGRPIRRGPMITYGNGTFSAGLGLHF